MDFVPLPTKITDRTKGQKYMYKDKITIWNGKRVLCEHGDRRERCKECGGSSICEHGRIKDICKECGGSSICEHGKERRLCRECEGTGICEHKIRRSICKTCSPTSHLANSMRKRAWGAMKNYSTLKDKKHTIEYIGCSWEDLRTHLENQFGKEAERCGHPISWENHGEWHIDHIKPCASFNLHLEDEIHKCFHYTNVQPMWAPDNISKSDTYDEDEDEREWDGEKWN